MSNVCQLTGKRPLTGNHVSHSNRKTKRRFNPNIQEKRIFIPEISRFIKVKIATSALRTIEKVGAFNFVKKQLAKGFDPKVWVENPNKKVSGKKAERGYRRVEHVDKNGNKSYSITYEAEAAAANEKVRLSSLFK